MLISAVAPRTNRYAAMTALFFALSLLLVFHEVSAGEPEEVPPLPFSDWGACPFECCMYREWTAEAPITVFSSRDEKSKVAFTLKKGERVRAVTGVVITLTAGATEIMKPLDIGYLPKGKRPMLSLKPGEIVHTLHYAGEGNDVFWYKGKTYEDQISLPEDALGRSRNADNVKVQSRPTYVWWAKVRNHSGRVGWTRSTDKFANQDVCG